MPTRQIKTRYIVHQHLQGRCSILTVLRPSTAGTVPVIRNLSKMQILDISDNAFTGTHCHDYLGVPLFSCAVLFTTVMFRSLHFTLSAFFVSQGCSLLRCHIAWLILMRA